MQRNSTNKLNRVVLYPLDYIDYTNGGDDDVQIEEEITEQDMIDGSMNGMEMPMQLPAESNQCTKGDAYNYVKLLYGDFNKKIAKYTTEILDQYQYEGSPIKKEYIDRYTIFVIVTKVAKLLQEDPEFEDFFEYYEETNMAPKIALLSDVEAVVINQIYMKYKKMEQ